MTKYINAEKLKAKIHRLESEGYYSSVSERCVGFYDALDVLKDFIDSLQQVQPNDICAKIKEYYGEELPFDDERTKAAYHFFSAGKAFELREYEEERGKHITDLLSSFRKGMNAGYEKALSELKYEQSDKTINLKGINYREIPAKTNDKICKDCDYFLDNGICDLDEGCPCEENSILERVEQEQPEVDIKKELHAYICSDEYINAREDGSLLIASHFFELARQKYEK